MRHKLKKKIFHSIFRFEDVPVEDRIKITQCKMKQDRMLRIWYHKYLAFRRKGVTMTVTFSKKKDE